MNHRLTRARVGSGLRTALRARVRLRRRCAVRAELARAAACCDDARRSAAGVPLVDEAVLSAQAAAPSGYRSRVDVPMQPDERADVSRPRPWPAAEIMDANLPGTLADIDSRVPA